MLESAAKLGMDRRTLGILRVMSERTRRDLERTNALAARWAGSSEPPSTAVLDAEGHAEEITYAIQQAFLEALVRMKDRSATAYQKASLLAPASFQDELNQLGAAAFEDSMRLRQLVIHLFGVTPYPESAHDALPPMRGEGQRED